MKIFKVLLFSSLLIGGVTSCTTDKEDKDLKKVDTSLINKENPAEIYAETFEFNFGEIAQGEKVEHKFKFKNTGSSPLILVDAKSTCGCTVPEIPTEPIAPGAEGEILVKFNSDYKKGEINKVISVAANTYPETTTKFYLKGTVIVPDIK